MGYFVADGVVVFRSIFQVLLLALIVTSGTAGAATFTYTFNMPAFDRDLDTNLVSGRSSILAIEVDNGNDTRVNQTYNFSDIISFTLVSLEGTTIDNVRLPRLRAFSGRDYEFLTTVGLSLPFVELGLATLDMSGSTIPDGETRSIMFGLNDPSGGFIDVQLAAENDSPNSNPFNYYVRVEALDIIGVYDDEFVTRSLIIAPTPVPVPVPALFLLSGIGLLTLLRHPSIKRRRLKSPLLSNP